jgi:hypothetical protein
MLQRQDVVENPLNCQSLLEKLSTTRHPNDKLCDATPLITRPITGNPIYQFAKKLRQ